MTQKEFGSRDRIPGTSKTAQDQHLIVATCFPFNSDSFHRVLLNFHLAKKDLKIHKKISSEKPSLGNTRIYSKMIESILGIITVAKRKMTLLRQVHRDTNDVTPKSVHHAIFLDGKLHAPLDEGLEEQKELYSTDGWPVTKSCRKGFQKQDFLHFSLDSPYSALIILFDSLTTLQFFFFLL